MNQILTLRKSLVCLWPCKRSRFVFVKATPRIIDEVVCQRSNEHPSEIIAWSWQYPAKAFVSYQKQPSCCSRKKKNKKKKKRHKLTAWSCMATVAGHVARLEQPTSAVRILSSMCLAERLVPPCFRRLARSATPRGVVLHLVRIEHGRTYYCHY